MVTKYSCCPGNPQDGAIRLVEEAPQHAEPVVVLGVAAGAVAVLTTARRDTMPLTAVGNQRRVRSLRWSLTAWLAYRGVFRLQ